MRRAGVMGRTSQKYYAVAKGRSTGVFFSWAGDNGAECLVKGFPGAIFKSFYSRAEADDFIKMNSNQPTKTSTFKHKNTTNVAKANYSSIINTDKYEQNSPIVAYTDGSCINSRGGVGVFFPSQSSWSISEPLPTSSAQQATNQRAELTAACRALETLIQHKHSSAMIITDSAYTIGCATTWINQWRHNGWRNSHNNPVANLDLVKRLENACSSINVSWKHVRAHQGEPGNEEADRLAKLGASSSLGKLQCLDSCKDEPAQFDDSLQIFDEVVHLKENESDRYSPLIPLIGVCSHVKMYQPSMSEHSLRSICCNLLLKCGVTHVEYIVTDGLKPSEAAIVRIKKIGLSELRISQESNASVVVFSNGVLIEGELTNSSCVTILKC